MKKIFTVVITAIAISLITGCHTVTSQIAYPIPINASETSVFVGQKMTYAEARNEAVSKALAEGYTKILSETAGFDDWIGLVVVSLTMIK